MAKAVSRQPMPVGRIVLHTFMMIVTCGCWTPVLLADRRSRKIITRTA